MGADELLNERNKGKKSRSIYAKMILPLMVVVAIQLGICLVLLIFSGNLALLKNEKYSNLYTEVVSRSGKVQDMLVDKGEFVKYYKDKVEEHVLEILAEKNLSVADFSTNEELKELVAMELASDVEDMLRGSRSTGAFVVLEGNESESELRYGYYLRNSKPGSTDTKDYSILRGSERLVENADIELDDNWRSGFRITDKEESNYYTKIRELYQQDEKEKYDSLGYWSPAFTPYGDVQKVITYTVPLVDAQGTFYGVLGIELNEEYLQGEMPYEEISSNGTGSFYLAYRGSNKDNYMTMVASSASGKDITDKNGYIFYEPYEDNIYKMDENLTDEYVGSIADIDLYSQKSPFAGAQWSVIGVADEGRLLDHYYKIMLAISGAVILVIIVGIMAVLYLCYRYVSYIRQMTSVIRETAPEEQIEIKNSSIREFDLLADAIKEMSERGTSSAKLAEIIDMVNMPIGAMEFKRDENFVFCTRSAANILEFHHVDKISQYLSKKAFEVETDVLRKNLTPYEEEEDVYRMVSKTGTDKWIRIKTKERDDRVLIAVLDVTADVLEKQKIEYERDYDILTRLLNRNAFRSKMGQLLKRGNLGISAVVMMDLDNLKFFNDTYGHDYGDRYIREAAVVLSTLNQYNALVARMSGDEFLMFIFGYSDKDEIRKLVSEVHERLLESYITVPTGEKIRLRASAGIAWYPDDATYLDELIKYADFAMYEIKSSKKGQIKEFDREVYQKDAVLFTGKEELNRLLEEPGMIRYIFQPIVEVATGEIFGYEALMRPQIEALRSPEDVMRLAKAQSKLYQMEKVTWMAALAAVEQQRKQGDTYKIFLNSVPNHVLEDKDTENLEKTYPRLLERVIIEIIESEQTDKSCMETKCEWAKSHHASIALDDFGTGYSNESTLLYISPDYVKLDRSIITNINEDESRQKIVQGLLTYTKAHGIKVIGEGIETFEEMKTLIRLGVDYMQGWYLARGQFEIQDIPVDLKAQIRQCVRELEEE